MFGDLIDRIYPSELDIRIPHSYLDLHLEIDIEDRFSATVYAKRDDSNFPTVTFHSYVATFLQHLHMEYISLR